ncbi:MAG TPA: alpha/beta fold hydrolase [Chloroflexota bacterium]|nr:alpha/beta fold hydrolase [Chloroflexota bacterium]
MIPPLAGKVVSVDGLRLRYSDAGTGPAVVLVHGIGASLEYWRFTVGALAQDHRVLAVDLPGCGFSERGPKVPTLEETADLMAGFLDALGVDRASFVGNSLGGLVCLETALRHPNRIDRLILSDSAGLGREVSIFWRLVSVPALGPALIELNRWLAFRGWINLFYQPQGDEPDLVARCQKWVGRPDLTETIVGAARSGVDLRGQLPAVVRVDRLAQLSMPTLVVWGKDDWTIPPEHGASAQRLIPNAQLVLIDRCGHCPQLERPDVFNRVAREFLATETPGT